MGAKLFIELILIDGVILLRAKMRCAYSTLLTARPNEARSASTLARYVVTVCAILAATDFGAVPAVEP